MKNIERQPKEHIENIRDRFMDFVGNPWNGVLGYLDSLQNDELSSESKERMLEGLKRCWNVFFKSLETFRNSGFEPVGKITIENIDQILIYKNKDPLQPDAVDEVDSIYHSIIDKLQNNN